MNTTPEALETLTKVLNDLRDAAKSLEADLAAPVLDGTPYALTVEARDGAGSFKLVYGQLYDEKTGELTQKTGFRYQRRFDLCGCFTMSEEKADANIARLRATYPTISKIHKRDWTRQQLESVKQSISTLEPSVAKLA